MSSNANIQTPGSDDWSGPFGCEMQELLQSVIRNFESCERFLVNFMDLNLTQGNTLVALPDNQPSTMNELSESLGLAQSTMTRTVDQLVAKGLVTRRTGEEDRREVLVALTDAGRQAKDEFEKARQYVVWLVMEHIPAEERETALSMLRKLNDGLAQAADECCDLKRVRVVGEDGLVSWKEPEPA